MQDPILQREHRRIGSRVECRLFLKVSIAQISTCVADSFSPGYNNTAEQKNKVGEELYIDAKRCINLTFKLALISCSEHE